MKNITTKMDPFYYLDLKLEENHTEDLVGLWNYYDYSPYGDWQLECNSNIIKYKDRTYSKIEYDNSTKIINFYHNDEITLTTKLYILSISKRFELNPSATPFIPQLNQKNDIKELANMIDDIKDNISDGKYLKLMNLLGKMFNK